VTIFSTRVIAAVALFAPVGLSGVLHAQITVPKTPPPTARAGGNITTKPPEGPVPRQANGRPDLTGAWLRRGGVGRISDGLPKGETMPLLPETLKRMQALMAKDDPQLKCLPLPTPRANPYPFRFVETPTHIFILNESMHGFRQIFMDGRGHPPADELQESWHGHSIGRWEGDTLVVDTVGFNDQSWFDNYGHLHSDKLHVTERFTRRNLGNLDIDITIDDPVAYSRTFTLKFNAQLMQGQELMEYMCEENNQDRPYIEGLAAPGLEAQKGGGK
jgi:hypothetical protein